MTKELFLIFARTIDKRGRDVPESDVKVKQLIRAATNLVWQIQGNEQLLDEQTLDEISRIKFVPPAYIDPIRQQIHPQTDVIPTSQSSMFTCFKDAVPEEHAGILHGLLPH